MKIIISPAKKISAKNDFTFLNTLPKHQDRAVHLYDILKKLTKDELKAVYKASDAIVTKSYDDIHNFDINKGFLHALLAYDGIQYQAMAPSVLDEDALTYLNEHLRILSGLYGALSPFDLIIPYRLEMGQSLSGLDLYDFWSDLYKDFQDEDFVIDLASNEYSKAITPYLKRVIRVTFLNDGIIKATYAKKARGAMVRYLAQHKISDPKAIVNFKDLHYHYSEELSKADEYVFVEEE